MNNEDEQSAHAEMNRLFESAGESPDEMQISRMLARARAIPVAGKSQRWVWIPLGASALLAAAALGFWIVGMRGVPSEVGVQAANVGELPLGASRDTVGSKAPTLRVKDEADRFFEPGAPESGIDGVDDEGLAEADEGAFENSWAPGSGTDTGLLLVDQSNDDAELGPRMGAEDLYGPLSEEDVEWWMLATNDLPGGG